MYVRGNYAGNSASGVSVTVGGVPVDLFGDPSKPVTEIKTMEEFNKFLADNKANLFFEKQYNTYVIEIKEERTNNSVANTVCPQGKRVDIRLQNGFQGSYVNLNQNGDSIVIKTSKFHVQIAVKFIEELLTQGRFKSPDAPVVKFPIPSADEEKNKPAPEPLAARVSAPPAPKEPPLHPFVPIFAGMHFEDPRSAQLLPVELQRTLAVVTLMQQGNLAVLKEDEVREARLTDQNGKCLQLDLYNASSLKGTGQTFNKVRLILPLNPKKCTIDLSNGGVIEENLFIKDDPDNVEKAKKGPHKVTGNPASFNYPIKGLFGGPMEGACGRIQGVIHKFEKGQYIEGVEVVIKDGVIKGNLEFENCTGRVTLLNGARIEGKVIGGIIV